MVTALNLIRRHLLEGFLQCGFAIDHELQAAIPQSAHAVLHGEGLNFTRSSFRITASRTGSVVTSSSLMDVRPLNPVSPQAEQPAPR